MAAPPIAERHLPHFHRRAPFLEKCRAATTANITISTALNNGDTLDGVTLATGDRVLVKDQTSALENGIYEVGASPARAYDLSTDDPNYGFLVFVTSGTANTHTLWENTNTSAITIGATSITFSQITAGSVAAAAVSIVDAGGYFTGTNVEDVLQELAKKDIGYTAHGNTGATETFDALTGWHSATLDSATVTFTFTGATSGLVAAMVLELAQDGTGGRLVTWPGSVVWPGGTAPTLSTAAAAVDILTFFSRDGGTTWYGFPTGSSPSSVTTSTYGLHAHIVSETHLSNGSATTYTLDQAIEPGTVIAWNTTTLARLGVTEAQPDQATVSAAGSSGDSIVFDYATPIVT